MGSNRCARLLLTGGAVAMSLMLVRVHAAGPVLSSLPSAPTFSVSTVPANGDVNPYGVAFVPSGFPSGGPLVPGDVLVSNFNNSANLQGTGTTIVRIDANGHQTLFFQGRGLLGLSTALGVLKSGFIVVGSVPTTMPTAACTTGPQGQEMGVNHGELLVLDRHGHVVSRLHSPELLDGPWDLTVNDQGETAQVFVSSVLNATVTRLDLAVTQDGRRLTVRHSTRIASGYARRCDPAALVVGPTGLAYDAAQDILYVASTGDNAIYAVTGAGERLSDQGPGSVFIRDDTHLHGPLGLVMAPNGDFITTQGDAVNPAPDPAHQSEIVEYSPTGLFIDQFSIDSAPGSAFGLAIAASDDGFRFAAVDDGLNVLDIWIVP